ncbi:hypothetical protein ACH41H_02855 [Streptomyces sp. NPDC020800]|uniref:hypothetical protein n=1 Tax=Streptomyces sp. NPDC020800 TaxID=3365092 RepID=UPI0037A44BDA
MEDGDHGGTVRRRLRSGEMFAGPPAESEPERAAACPERAPAHPVRPHLTDTAERDHGPAKSPALIDEEPPLVGSARTVYALAPAEAEFRQAARSRLHTRLRHARTADGRQRSGLRS